LEGLLVVGRDRAFLGFAGLWALTYVVYSQLYQVVPAYLHLRLHFPPGVFGYLAAENALLVVVLQQPIVRAMARVPGRWPLTVGLLCYAAGFLLMWHARWLVSFFAAVVVITLGENLVNPTASSWVAQRADARLRGRYLGFFSLAQRVGQSLGPLTGGFLLSMGTAPWLLSVAGLGVLTAAAYRRVRDPGRMTQPTADGGAAAVP
jgi:MFS family permease